MKVRVFARGRVPALRRQSCEQPHARVFPTRCTNHAVRGVNPESGVGTNRPHGCTTDTSWLATVTVAPGATVKTWHKHFVTFSFNVQTSTETSSQTTYPLNFATQTLDKQTASSKECVKHFGPLLTTLLEAVFPRTRRCKPHSAI